MCNNNYKKKDVVENHILAEHRDKLSEGKLDIIGRKVVTHFSRG